MPFCDADEGGTAMKKILLLFFWTAVTIMANGQELSADKLIDMLSFTVAKSESLLFNKRYHSSGTVFLGDTAVTTYEYFPVFSNSKQKKGEAVSRKFIRSVLQESFLLTYQTTSSAEYKGIITALKKTGFYCEYEKDSTKFPASYVYQHEAYTAEASLQQVADSDWYSITFHKKIFPVDREIHYAEDLLQFTSHEYLVYYFGAKNVKKDLYYFGGKDIAKCSVLLINTNRQVIFIWRDALNSRKIGNLIFGGVHKLKSLEGKDSLIAENSWMLKSGLHAGMPLYDLRILNEKNIIFCGGDAPNPGLVIPESTGMIDFKNNDLILGCMNCSDDKFRNTKIMNADKAMKDGRILFILIIVLYPVINGTFD